MNVLNVIASGTVNEPTIGDIILYGVIGQLIVFLVLAVLIGIVYLIKLAFLMFVKKGEKKPAEVSAPVLPESPESNDVSVTSEDEIAAVIGAVMAIYYGSGNTANVKAAPFKVKKIYRLK